MPLSSSSRAVSGWVLVSPAARVPGSASPLAATPARLRRAGRRCAAIGAARNPAGLLRDGGPCAARVRTACGLPAVLLQVRP